MHTLKKLNNYNIMFGLRTLKSIFIIFCDSFLVLYFFELSDSNILPIAMYKLVSIFTVYIVMFLVRNICKTKYRIHLIRLGIIVNFIYFLSMLILREHVIDYIYMVGFLYGLQVGLYQSTYNNLESNMVSNKQRAKFLGSYYASKSIISIIFPLIFGNLIYEEGFAKALIVVLIIVFFQIILSCLIKDKNVPKKSKTNLIEYMKIVKENRIIKNVYKKSFFNGLTYEGAFKYIVTIYIIRVFSTSVSLGIFTSIFALITCVLGILFAKLINPQYYGNLIKITMIFTIVSLCIMIYNCTMTTIILFNLFQTISLELVNLINESSDLNISNISVVKKNYKVEYWLGNETALFLGRVLSSILFIFMSFTSSNFIIYIFVIFVLLFANSSTQLQEEIKDEM